MARTGKKGIEIACYVSLWVKKGGREGWSPVDDE